MFERRYRIKIDKFGRFVPQYKDWYELRWNPLFVGLYDSFFEIEEAEGRIIDDYNSRLLFKKRIDTLKKDYPKGVIKINFKNPGIKKIVK